MRTAPVRETGGGRTYSNDTELKQSLHELANDEDVRRNLGFKGYQAYERHYTEEAHLKQYLDLVSEIMTTKK